MLSPDAAGAFVQVPIESTGIASASYGDDQGVLELRFHSGGVCRYFGVPVAVRDAFLAAPSKGRYFNEAIRGQFEFQRS